MPTDGAGNPGSRRSSSASPARARDWMTMRSPAVWPPPAKRMARSTTASKAWSRARLAGCTMAYSRCNRVRAAVSPWCHHAAASCWRKRSRTPAASVSMAARRSARVMAGPSGREAAHLRALAAPDSLCQLLPVPVHIIERPTTTPRSPVISTISRPAIRPGSIPAIAAAPAMRGPCPRSLVSSSRQRHGLPALTPTPTRAGNARLRSSMLPI